MCFVCELALLLYLFKLRYILLIIECIIVLVLQCHISSECILH